jgi:hypothetical protein
MKYCDWRRLIRPISGDWGSGHFYGQAEGDQMNKSWALQTREKGEGVQWGGDGGGSITLPSSGRCQQLQIRWQVLGHAKHSLAGVGEPHRESRVRAETGRMVRQRYRLYLGPYFHGACRAQPYHWSPETLPSHVCCANSAQQWCPKPAYSLPAPCQPPAASQQKLPQERTS